MKFGAWSFVAWSFVVKSVVGCMMGSEGQRSRGYLCIVSESRGPVHDPLPPIHCAILEIFRCYFASSRCCKMFLDITRRGSYLPVACGSFSGIPFLSRDLYRSMIQVEPSLASTNQCVVARSSPTELFFLYTDFRIDMQSYQTNNDVIIQRMKNVCKMADILSTITTNILVYTGFHICADDTDTVLFLSKSPCRDYQEGTHRLRVVGM